jgi:CrcB protein
MAQASSKANKMIDSVCVGIGGVAGSLLRFGVGEALSAVWPYVFPLPTLAINLIGAFLLGLLTGAGFPHLSPRLKVTIGTGLIGSWTTFSTINGDTVRLAESGHFFLMGGNMFVSAAGGLLMTFFGYRLAARQHKGSEVPR